MHEISRVLAGYRSTERAGIKKIRLGNERIFRMHARNDLKCASKARWSIVALPTLKSRTDSFFHAHTTQHVLLGRWHFRFLPPRGGFLDREIGHFTEGLRTVQVGRIDLVVIGKDLKQIRKRKMKFDHGPVGALPWETRFVQSKRAQPPTHFRQGELDENLEKNFRLEPGGARNLM